MLYLHRNFKRAREKPNAMKHSIQLSLYTGTETSALILCKNDVETQH